MFYPFLGENVQNLDKKRRKRKKKQSRFQTKTINGYVDGKKRLRNDTCGRTNFLTFIFHSQMKTDKCGRGLRLYTVSYNPVQIRNSDLKNLLAVLFDKARVYNKPSCSKLAEQGILYLSSKNLSTNETCSCHILINSGNVPLPRWCQ